MNITDHTIYADGDIAEATFWLGGGAEKVEGGLTPILVLDSPKNLLFDNFRQKIKKLRGLTLAIPGNVY